MKEEVKLEKAKKYEDKEIYESLNPIVVKWFKEKFSSFTESQRYAMIPIRARKNILISSPTGTGKTLCAFGSILNYLIDLDMKNELEDKVYAVYISPLKALVGDVEVNLKKPLEEMEKIAGKKLNIRIAMRTGDTTTEERAKQTKNLPHILVTTPETLAIVLNAPKFSLGLKAVEFIIVDEIHALANKRGVHLSLSLERLEEMSKITPVRIGLSATIAPLSEIAKFLTGNRDCIIADVDFAKKLDVEVITPVSDLIEDGLEMHSSLYKLLDKLIQEHKTTLIFTNTRSATERVIHHLKEMFPSRYLEDPGNSEISSPSRTYVTGGIGAHHSSLSKEHRFDIENRLREGKLKVVVCLDGDTKILDGKGNWIKIKDIKEEEIQSINERFKLNNNRIRNIFKIKNNENLLKLKTEFGKEIISTKEHKFLTIDKEGNLLWKEAEKLDVSEFVATIRNYSFNELKEEELEELTFDNYPDKYFLFFKKEFLEKLKSIIYKKFDKLKRFWLENLKDELAYSPFIHLLDGRHGIRTKIIRRIIKSLNLNKIEVFKAISMVSSEKYKMLKPIISKDLMRLIGFMMAEGYLTEENLFVSNRNKKLLKYYKELIKEISGKTPWEKMSSSGTPILGWSSMFLSNFLKNLGFLHGRKARIMNIPDFIFRLNSNLVFDFLSGYLDGDGYLEVKGKKRVYAVGFCTTSKEMADDVSRLLLRESILSSVRSRYCDEIQKLKDGREIIKKGWFYDVVVLGGENLRKFAEKINPVRENLRRIKEVLLIEGYTNLDRIPNLGKKLKKLRNQISISTYKLQKLGLNPEKYELGMREISRKQLIRLLSLYNINDKQLLKLAYSDLFWEKIRTKEEVAGKEIVYNIEVENNHNYVANGFLTKNCSTSLELGIDIGYIDLVILLGSPKSSARSCQRIGRSGHKLHDIAKGRFIVLDRDDLVECCVMKKEIIERKIDKVQVPKNCLDVLSQQIYGMAISRIWNIKEMFQLIKKSYCYSELRYDEFLGVISYLAGEYALEDKQVYAKIWYDASTGEIGKKGKLARVIYMTNIGTIPDESFISVVLARGEGKEGSKIGVIDEAFFERLKPRDVFVLGGKKYEFLYSRGMKAYVNSSVYKPPTIPSWFSEMLPLSFDLALEISRFRGLVEEKLKMKKSRGEIEGFIRDFCYIDEKTAGKIYDYLELQFRYLSLPSNKKIIIENYKGEKNYWIFHSLFGRRVNDCLSRAIAFCLGRLMARDVEIGINDNGFFLVGEKIDKEKINKALNFLNSKNLEEVLKETIEKTEIFKRRFRHTAVRSLMILRQYKGRVKSAGKQQIKSHFLLAAIQKLTKEFPILKETRREILEEVMDLENSKLVLDWLKENKTRVEFKETLIPSPFSLNLIMQGHYDLIKIEDKIEFLKRIYKEIKERVKE